MPDLPQTCVGRAFTMIEVLVVAAIISVLVAIVLPALSKAKQCAVITGELSAARQMAAAYQMYSTDNAGKLLIGYASASHLSRGGVIARDRAGERIYDVRGQRYPWRLIPYLDNNLELLQDDPSLLTRQAEGNSFLFEYGLSLAPRFGLNQVFLGGSADRSDPSGGVAFDENPRVQEAIRRSWGTRWYADDIAEIPRPTNQIVFASATGSPSIVAGESLSGYWRITPPNFRRREWRDDPTGSVASASGNVSFRFAGRTVALMADAHAETLGKSELDDMRRWNPWAGTSNELKPPLR
jgi:prepilin-type N-terminal cleavage/methylation domain-containing protein